MDPVVDTIESTLGLALTSEQRQGLKHALAQAGVVPPHVLVEVCDKLTELDPGETDKALRKLSSAMNGELEL